MDDIDFNKDEVQTQEIVGKDPVSGQNWNWIINVLKTCKDAAQIDYFVQEKIWDAIKPNRTDLPEGKKVESASLGTLQKSLLRLASHHECTDGIFFAIPIYIETNHGKYIYLRGFESGCFRGFLCSKKVEDMVKNEASIEDAEVLVSRIYTDWDIKAEKKHLNSFVRKPGVIGTGSTKRIVQTFKNNVFNNTNSIRNILPIVHTTLMRGLKNDFKLLGTVFFTQKHNCSLKGVMDEKKKQAYFKLETFKLDWYNALLDYVSIAPSNMKISMEDECKRAKECQDMNVINQMKVISSIPNYHNWTAESSRGVKMEEFFMQGSSPRSQLLKILMCDNFEVGFPEEEVNDLVKAVMNDDYKLLKRSKSITTMPRPNKKQKTKINKEIMLDSLGLSHDVLEEKKQATSLKVSTYEHYKRTITMNGILKWRVHTSSADCVVLNDYDVKTSDMKKESFVHTWRRYQNKSISWDCSCEGYRLIEDLKRCQYEGKQWDIMKCHHCSFMEEILQLGCIPPTHNSYHDYTHVPDVSCPTNLGEKVREALNYVTESVVACSSSKYSVITNTELQFVQTFQGANGKLFVQCQSGLCQRDFGKKRLVVSLTENDNICSHLAMYRDNYISNNEDALANNEDVDYVEQCIEEVIPDAQLLGQKRWEDVFDEVTGMWLFGSPYGHTVSTDEFSEELSRNLRSRMNIASDIVQGREINNNFYPTFNNDEKCECELPWIGCNYEFDCKSTLYTRSLAFRINTFKASCSNNNCTVYWTGEKEAVFRSSKDTCMGYEFGWEYIQSVKSTKSNFAGFCEGYTNTYKRINPNGLEFMRGNTFVNWFFSWASHQKIDFRKSCFGCGEVPSIMACDGTKIGMPRKDVRISPIESTKIGEAIPTPHNRNSRCFLPYSSKFADKKVREARNQLREASKQNYENTKDLLEVLPLECKPLFMEYIENKLNEDQLCATGRLLYLLSFDSSLRAVLPLETLPKLSKFLTDVEENNDIDFSIGKYYENFSVDFGIFMKSFLEVNVSQSFISFTKYLVTSLESLHSHDVQPDEISLVNSYNPPKHGRAYYFTKDGSQLRNPRKFTMDVRSGKKEPMHDDKPTMSSCRKLYGVGSSAGSTYLFVWFCPMHGHCYGMHIIDGDEGRKDACQSLYAYLPEAPKTIFYDFGCNLEEYCLNRESGYFKETRFYHDHFHGANHNCSKIYSSAGLADMDRRVNTSICEQFNSYLQCVKSSLRFMSQNHFMFYVQFMIHQWNQQKEESYKKKVVALSESNVCT